MKKVKIIHSGFSDNCWYNKFVGQSFEYITEDAENYWVKTGDKMGNIEKCDGEIIEEEINTHPVLQDLLQQQKNGVNQVFGPGLNNQNVVTNKHQRIGTFCDKCRQVVCICEKKSFKEQKPTKQSEGKLFYELDFDFLTEMAKRMQANKSGKYERFGWKKGLPLEEVKQAGLRHYLEVMKGNYEDDGEKYGHIVATAINCMLMLHELKRQEELF